MSGRWDLNPRPLQPHCSALAGLRYAPNAADYNWYNRFMQVDPPASSRAPLAALALIVIALIVIGGAFYTGLIALPAPPPSAVTPTAVSNATSTSTYRLAIIDGEDIYTATADGREQTRFTPRGDVPIASLIWSRDGARLIYSQVLGDRGQLISATADGADRLTLFDGERVAVPFYFIGAPDDRHVAFLISDSINGLDLQVAEIDRAGSAQSIARGQPNYASWSPDGQALLLHIGGSGPDAFIGTYRLGDDAPRPVEKSPAFFQAPMWSPQGEGRWLYARRGGDVSYLVINDGGRERQLAEFDDGVAFSWSPDAQHVAYAVNTPTSFVFERLTVIDRSGVTSTVVHRGDLMGFFWSPDSRRLAYLTGALIEPGTVGQSGGRLAAPRIVQGLRRLQLTWHVIELSTGEKTELTTFAPSEAFVYVLQYFDQFAQSIALWSPDSRYLLYTGTPLAGETGVYVIAAQDGAAPQYVGPGQFAAFAWR